MRDNYAQLCTTSMTQSGSNHGSAATGANNRRDDMLHRGARAQAPTHLSKSCCFSEIIPLSSLTFRFRTSGSLSSRLRWPVAWHQPIARCVRRSQVEGPACQTALSGGALLPARVYPRACGWVGGWGRLAHAQLLLLDPCDVSVYELSDAGNEIVKLVYSCEEG